MPQATLYEHKVNLFTTFSFVVGIVDDVWALTVDGTLPQTIPAIVVQPPGSGSAKILYEVMAVGSANLGPVKIVSPSVDPQNVSAVLPLKKGDMVTIQILGRLPE